ncbi:MAG: LTA synthase family protein [Oscillibacter sp.]|nr:LTA synthase family protein [Oscillibacter sp.]
MKRKNIKKAPRYQLGLLSSVLLAVLLAGVITLLCLWVQPNSLRNVLSVFRSQPLLIVLNCLPIGLLVLAFASIFGNVFSSACLVGTCCAFLSMASRIKISVRDEPVFPRDFGLLKEVFSAAGTYRITWPWVVIAVILVYMVLTKIAARFVGCKPFPVEALRSWGGRIAGAFGSLAVLVALILTVYASNDLYNSFTTSNPYYIPTVFNELGFPYCFCHNFTTYTVDRPDGYSRVEAESWEIGDVPGQGADVNVIMVMNEAFSDLTDCGAFSYAPEEDPLKNFHAAQESAHCVSGHVVVPGFAGGTANTEFDVLTGMQTNALSATTTSAFRAVNQNLDSMFRVFNTDGYTTEFLHPGDAWFYNRENVYQWLGAQSIEFAKDMTNPAYKGRWVTDDYMAGQLEEHFASAIAAGTPLFNYTTTIQNHMSYTADKYGADYAFPALQTTADLSSEAETLLKVYIEGVRDADAMLGRLTDYFSQSDEPVVLVFWGDHLPYLGDGQLAYNELNLGLTPEDGGTENYLRAYETPYVIWANDAAAQTLDWDKTVASLDLPEDGTLSACYLGSTVLELTGRSEESPWFAYLSEVRRELPVIQRQTYMTADGTVTADLTQEQQTLLSKLRCWSYYKLKYKDVE